MGLAETKLEKLYEACSYGRNNVVKYLIDRNADVNGVLYAHDNSSPLHVAAQGQLESCRLLLENGAKPDVRDDRGNTPLHHAAQRGKTDIIKLLAKYGADVDCVEKSGWTPLIVAAYRGHLEATQALLELGAQCNCRNKDGRNALHETARSPVDNEQTLKDICSLLLNAGCDKDVKSSAEMEADFTPLMAAAYHGHVAVAEQLITAGCDVHAFGTNGWTALHWASDRNHTELVKLLLGAGADPRSEAERKQKALHRAKSLEVKQLLKEKEEAVIREGVPHSQSYPSGFEGALSEQSSPTKSVGSNEDSCGDRVATSDSSQTSLHSPNARMITFKRQEALSDTVSTSSAGTETEVMEGSCEPQTTYNQDSVTDLLTRQASIAYGENSSVGEMSDAEQHVCNDPTDTVKSESLLEHGDLEKEVIVHDAKIDTEATSAERD